jgi:hypothetical protein
MVDHHRKQKVVYFYFVLKVGKANSLIANTLIFTGQVQEVKIFYRLYRKLNTYLRF